ncbi:Pumilio domain-containing protein C6G9.14 [Diplonema papillatum]|nr:Pumilio domain-containing protein C6G9.14 [Diplonema papillatum]
MAEADLGTLLAGFGAPPPLLTMDQEEEKARERREGSNGTGDGRAPADEPCGGDAANGTAQEGGSPALNQPPELLPAGDDRSAEPDLKNPPQLLAVEDGQGGPNSSAPTASAPEPAQRPHMTAEKLKQIRTQKEALQKELERLQNAEDELAYPGAEPANENNRPTTPTVQCRVATGSPPPLVTPPTQALGLGGSVSSLHSNSSQPSATHGAAPNNRAVPAGIASGTMLTLDQALHMASVGWNLASTPPPGHTPHHTPPVSALLSRQSPGPRLTPDNVLKVLRHSRLTDFVRDQNGLTWLQTACEEGTEQDVAAIFEVLSAEQPEVFTDPVTSPLVPILYLRLSEAQKDVLVEKIATNMAQIAFNMHGTRVVQKIIEQVNQKHQVDQLVTSLQHQIPQLIKDLNGNHIVQQVLQSFPADVNQYIHDTLLNRVVEFGTHRHGCCVLQRCIEFGNDSQKMQLVYEVINNGLCLVQDPFGNYLLQYILEMDLDYINVKVIRQFLGNIPALSMNKFASNVIEKCLKIAPEDVRQLIVDELAERSKLHLLLQDQYANYVIQTALHTCSQAQFYSLHTAIRPLMHLIKNTPHGKRIETKLRTRTFDGTQAQTPQRRHVQRGDALGVTPDGQWLRGNEQTPGFQPSSVHGSHGDPTGTPPMHLTPPHNFLQPQLTPNTTPGSAAGFRLNVNARPFVSPPSSTGPTASGTATPDRFQTNSANVSSNNSPAQRSMHPALVFGGLDD